MTSRLFIMFPEHNVTFVYHVPVCAWPGGVEGKHRLDGLMAETVMRTPRVFGVCGSVPSRVLPVT